MQQPKEEYGWVLIDTPEKKREMGPVKEGDQVFICPNWTSPGEWRRPLNPEFDSTLTYRRPVDVGEGWELVPVGDVIKEGDQFLFVDSWRDCSVSIGLTIGSEKRPANHLCIRRRKKPEAKARKNGCRWAVLNPSSGVLWLDDEKAANERAKHLEKSFGGNSYVFRAVRKFESKTEILETEL